MNFNRARNYRLYNASNRVLDMELDGGRCLFGHNPKGLGKSYKNSISRALYIDVPNTIHARVIKGIKSMFPGFQAVVLPDRSAALSLLADETGVLIDSSIFSLFSFHREYEYDLGTSHIYLWRPFSGMLPQDADILLPVMPQPGYFSPQIILYRRDSGLHPRNIPLCSPILLYGLYHTLLLLERAMHYGGLVSVARPKHQPKKHRNSRGITRAWFSEEQWKRFLPPSFGIWKRCGPYVYVHEQIPDEPLSSLWATVRAEYHGLRLPQSARQVLILPSLASHAEEGLIRAFFQRTEMIKTGSYQRNTNMIGEERI